MKNKLLSLRGTSLGLVLTKELLKYWLKVAQKIVKTEEEFLDKALKESSSKLVPKSDFKDFWKEFYWAARINVDSKTEALKTYIGGRLDSGILRTWIFLLQEIIHTEGDFFKFARDFKFSKENLKEFYSAVRISKGKA